MNAHTFRNWMTAAIAAPVIRVAGAGVASAQSSSPLDPPRAPMAVAQAAAPAAAPTDPAAQPGGPGGRDGWHRHHHRPHGMLGVRPDANGNVARSDVQAAQQRQLAMFDRADANHDGVLSRDERSAFREQMREMHHKPGGPQAPGAVPPAPPKG